MDKKEIIQKLENGNFHYGVAEMICNVFNRQGKAYNNQSILVVVDKGSLELVDDKIIDSKHWFIFNSIAEFANATIIVKKAEDFKFPSPLGKTVVGEFLEVRDFVSYLIPKDRNGKEIHVNDKVRWHDPDKQNRDLKRIYTISRIKEDIILICDGFSEVETSGCELELVE